MEEKGQCKNGECSDSNIFLASTCLSSDEKKIFSVACAGRKQNSKNLRTYGGFRIEAAASPMSILSWNCQGAGSTETVQQIREYRRKYFPDFLFLMETKQKFEVMNGMKKSLGYDQIVTVEPEGLSGGLAVMWKDCYQVLVLSSDKRIIDLQITMGSTAFFLSCVYGDPVRAKRREVWDRLSSIALRRDEAWLLAGDFNELLSNEEKSGGAIREESTFWDFRNMVQNCKVRELRHTGNSLSWGGWRDKAWVQCRLDRSFGNSEWFSLFPRSNMEYLDLWASDHRPIRICFSLERDEPRKGRFFFDKRMLSRVGFEDLVRKSWEGDGDVRGTTMDRISRCRRKIMEWRKQADLNSREKIVRLRAALEKEVVKVFPSYRLMQKMKQELAAALREEELFWRQKCREEWLRAGDRNTKYFHNCVKGRRIQNRILMLLDDNNQEHFSEGAKGELAVAFFRDLFTSSNPFDLETLFQGFSSRVTEDMNTVLIALITTEEIKEAAFCVKGSSAPGEDGLTGLIYQKFWHIIGPTLTEEITQFFNTSVLPEGWNHTQLSLLPKIMKPDRMKDMRPISLCSVQYKIISKILCNRLKLVLPEIISETQGAFVAGRLISDNIIIAHEMVHGLHTNEKIAKDWMAIKTDMSKAYDRVEWNFLEVLMEKMGFAHRWIRWIMACVTTVTFSVLLNGNAHGFIRPERGIRQGDPLSPFLFILCAEALVSKLNNSETMGNLHGIKLAATSPSVHHLLFADDSLLLCKSSKEEAEEIMRCIKMYGDASGQMVNFQKSSIIFGSLVPEQTKTLIKESTCIEAEGGEGSYLGLPECFSGSKRNLLSFIREKLKGRLNGWFAKALSQGGKEILIKSVGLALPIFAMSCFKLPKDTCAKLTSALTEFWWSSGNNRKKISWVAWQKLCQDKEAGGLGFKDLEKLNQSLLAKQAWRIWDNPQSLVARLLRSRYFKNTEFLDSGVGSRPSYAWRSIVHGKDLMKQGLLKVVGDGEDTRVWLDNWLLGPLPRPPCYRQDALVDLTLRACDLMVPNSGDWDVGKLRNLFTEEDVQLVLQIKRRRHRRDELKWGLSRNGVYDSKTGYQLLVELSNINSPQPVSLPPLEKNLWRNLWKTSTSPKLRHFLWRILSGALAVKQQLVSRGIPTEATCPMCRQEPETICHMLFHCPLAKEVWELSSLPLPPAGFSMSSTFLNLHYLLECSKKKLIAPKVRLAFPWILWQIWKNRNLFCFEKRKMDARNIIEKAMEEASIWLQLHSFIPPEAQPIIVEEQNIQVWEKPLSGFVKCNVSHVWSASTGVVGAAWIVRDHCGKPLFHSRRSFGGVKSQNEATMVVCVWVTEALNDIKMRNVILEMAGPQIPSSFSQFSLSWLLQPLWRRFRSALDKLEMCKVARIPCECNSIAATMASSALQVQWQQSYLARNGPEWLDTRIRGEA